MRASRFEGSRQKAECSLPNGGHHGVAALEVDDAQVRAVELADAFVGEHRFGCPVADTRPASSRNTWRQAGRQHLEFVADEDHAHAGSPRRAFRRFRTDAFAPPEVQVGGGFVEQQQLRLLGHGAGDDGLALLAAGNLAEGAVRQGRRSPAARSIGPRFASRRAGADGRDQHGRCGQWPRLRARSAAVHCGRGAVAARNRSAVEARPGPRRARTDTPVPKTVTSPRVGEARPRHVRSRVVLPAPFGPMSATKLPDCDPEVPDFEQAAPPGVDREAVELDGCRCHGPAPCSSASTLAWSMASKEMRPSCSAGKFSKTTTRALSRSARASAVRRPSGRFAMTSWTCASLPASMACLDLADAGGVRGAGRRRRL